MAERMKLLITVKTYPLPSVKYDELVCTAGVLEDGRFVRLYPIEYRYRPYSQWFSKYQWVQVYVEKHRNDPRPESYRPIGEIRPLGEPLATKDRWADRKRYVLARDIPTMCDLEKKRQTEVSLGIIRPRSVQDLVVEQTDRDWKPEWQARMLQLRLFGPQSKPLEKIPYRFSYIFRCENPDCGGHKKMIEDWEVGELYRSMRDKYENESVACEKVKQKLYHQMCAEGVDTHFFVGTTLEYGSWIILGTFWPKKDSAGSGVLAMR